MSNISGPLTHQMCVAAIKSHLFENHTWRAPRLTFDFSFFSATWKNCLFKAYNLREARRISSTQSNISLLTRSKLLLGSFSSLNALVRNTQKAAPDIFMHILRCRVLDIRGNTTNMYASWQLIWNESEFLRRRFLSHSFTGVNGHERSAFFGFI